MTLCAVLKAEIFGLMRDNDVMIGIRGRVRSKTQHRIFVLIVVAIFLLVSLPSILNKFFWFDEAGQFWISQGLNHYSNPNSKSLGLLDVIKSNREYSFDPGGFSVLLSVWSSFINLGWWLRLLPLISSVIFLGTYLFLMHKLKVSLIKQFCVIIFVVCVGAIGNHLTEIRPYSLEFALFTIALFSYLNFDKNQYQGTYVKIFWIAGTIGITVRYGSIFWFVAFLISLLLLDKRNFFRFLSQSAFYLLVYLSVSILVFFVSFQYQVGVGESLSYLTYIHDDFLMLFSPGNIIFFLYFIVIVSISIRRALNQNNLSVLRLSVFTCILLSLFLIGSIMGVYPWDPYSKNMAVLTLSLTLLSVTNLGFSQIQPVFRVEFCFLFILLVSIVTAFNHYSTFHLPSENRNQGTVDFFKSSNRYCSREELIYVDDWMSPSIRMMFETDLRNYSYEWGYPGRFIFRKGFTHTSSSSSVQLPDKSEPIFTDLSRFCILAGPYLQKIATDNGYVRIRKSDFFVLDTR